MWLARDRRLVRRSFASSAQAKAWRTEASNAARTGSLRPPGRITVEQAAEAWLTGVKRGEIRDRSGMAYKPSTLRGYERSLRQRIVPSLGTIRLSELRRQDVQGVVDELAADLSPSTIRNALDPLRAICRRAIAREVIAVNPTHELELPAVRGKRDRIASVSEAAELVAALDSAERALWATAFYAGLRRGELRALRVSDVDLGRSEVSVERSWDQVEGPIDPKSEAGRRVVPLLALLRDHLDEHLLATGRTGAELVFGRTPELPFVPSTIRTRALARWEPAQLKPIALQECRHTFASLLIDSGANAKAIQEFMGHATIQMTFDRYGHLMPGRRDEVRNRMDAYLEASQSVRLINPAAKRRTSASEM